MTGVPPLVLVHGLWDTPRLFDPLSRALAGERDRLLVPFLPHSFGARRMIPLAEELGRAIDTAYGPEQMVDLLGFSMGGVIGRCWIQLLGGHHRTRRFISVASPQQGTLLAQVCPSWLLGGIAELKMGSPLIQRLNEDVRSLASVECLSLFTPIDQVVVPGWRGVLPVGKSRSLPATLHQFVLRDPRCLAVLRRELLRP
ncbi:triacylglycerol lipase [Cyanobium sp. Morenito 9A2]|uniref:esterase/lipase family protein n=1 Tax=Cyanobium sp. Morenito 9A2 TaxID=2823718 RepID=UPI0020CBBB1D|nr:alpha/beta hydrolase [Cyanobium sp. Morenito 9A2]MCP9849385.1 alpha/beta hydrolase [Cyanobium sp. Morenito 9A2]